MSRVSISGFATLVVFAAAAPSRPSTPSSVDAGVECGALAADDDHHDSVSLLQRQATLSPRPSGQQGSGEGLSLSEADFHGHFHLCRHVPVGWHANCEHAGGDLRSEEVDSPKGCTRLALQNGADTFNFRRDTQTCSLLRCGGEDLHLSRRLAHNSWEVHSTWCGVRPASMTTTFAPSSRVELEEKGDCGTHTSHFAVYPEPPRKACTNSIDLSKVVNNNLGGMGPSDGQPNIRFHEALPGTDLIVVATSSYQPKVAARNGLNRMFGTINVQSNTQVDLAFKFVESGTDKLRHIDSLFFSFFNIDQAKGCTARMEVEVSDFAAYYVSEKTKLHVAHDEENRLLLRSTVKGEGRKGPSSPTRLNKSEERNAVTFLFEEISEFWATLHVKRGLNSDTARNFLFAGASSLLGGACD